MTRQYLYSTILAGVMGFSTLVLFHNGAEALDLSDFTGADQKVITQDAPKAGGIVLVKEDVVDPSRPTQVRTVIAQPVMRATPMLTGAYGSAASYNNIMPAAGGTTFVGYRAGDGTTGVPGKGIDNKVDITTMPGNSYDQVRAKFAVGGASDPVDGKPLTTTTLANGARVNDLNEIAPAAGGGYIRSSIDSGQSVQSMTGRGSNTYNN
jgi:hypothetical protein